MPVRRSLSTGSKVTIRYKLVSDTAWKDAHPLLRINPAWVEGSAPVRPIDSFAGTIFDLAPGTTYEIEITLTEPGAATQVQRASASTRALPPAAPAVTVRANPSENLQSKINALSAGSVLELDNGTYNVSNLVIARSGTITQPIYIRGQSRDGVVLRNAGRLFQIQAASNVVIENMTLVGSGVDSGTNASSVGISFWNGAVQSNITMRDLDIRGVDQGIIASGETSGLLIYNNTLRGNNVWQPEYLHTNLTWNDDGIRIPGEGNVAFENTLYGFGDSLAVIDGVMSAAVYFYRNRIEMTGDDAFEADYGTRNMAMYDTFITNSGTFLSTDPIWGGPLYVFRNISINTFRGPFKLNNTNSGFLIYNNTIVRTEGRTGWGWVQFNNGATRNWSYRNNILIYRGGNSLLAYEASGNDPIDVTNNAWFPNGPVWWSNSGGSFNSIAQALAGLPATTPLFGTSTHRHFADVISESDPFATPITLGTDHLTMITSNTLPQLRAGTAPKNSGTAIPNITDGFSGASPDMGALIQGRSTPRYGAQR